MPTDEPWLPRTFPLLFAKKSGKALEDASSKVRSVYFPKAPPGGAVRYTHRFTNQTYAAGSTAQVPVPKLDEFPLFSLKAAVGR